MKLSNALVVLDLETTGIWVERDKIIEIAMIKKLPSGEQATVYARECTIRALNSWPVAVLHVRSDPSTLIERSFVASDEKQTAFTSFS